MSRSRCPDCDQGDRALETYADGNTFCHACRKVSKVKSLIEIKTEPRKILELPEDDNSCNFPEEAVEYLGKYHLTTKLVRDNGIFWSSDYRRLVFPLYFRDIMMTKKLVSAWMRSVEENPVVKTMFVGNKTFKSWVVKKSVDAEQTKQLVIVEDVTSAIRVSQFCDCLFLAGTVMTDETQSRCLAYKELVVWLDGDKAGRDGAEKIRNRFKVLRPIKILKTKQDPKCFKADEIRRILSE